MLFSSIEFIFVFLPIVLLIYWALSKLQSDVIRKAWLVIASLFFYGYWKPIYLLLIIASMLVNYAIGHSIQKPLKLVISSKQLLTVGIIFNVGLLGFFKYADFFIDNLNWLTGSGIANLELLLPLAISFFTFQQIAYLVDCYQKDAKEYDFLSYSLFVTFFPQLIAGPIVHHKQMMPQFSKRKNRGLKLYNLYTGTLIFTIGLFKKVVIADTFAGWANEGFSNTAALHFYDAWLTSLSYTFQLYYDFSGYSDMAIGAALLFNIRLPINFNSPYKATSIQDFWRRWHITLSNWLRDYVYIPLGGSRCSKQRIYLNVLITMIIGGFWHGAGWTFVIWGALQGSALALHRAWSHLGLRMYAFLGWAFTFIFTVCSWVMFRAERPEQALQVYKGMLGLNGVEISQNTNRLINWLFDTPLTTIEHEANFIISPIAALWTIAFALIAFFGINSMHLSGYYHRQILSRSYMVPIVAGFMFAAAMLVMLTSPVSDFLYFNF